MDVGFVPGVHGHCHRGPEHGAFCSLAIIVYYIGYIGYKLYYVAIGKRSSQTYQL